MSNFAPLSERFMIVLRENLDLFGIRGRFLDYGAGPGAVSRFLVSDCDMPAGYAYDPALLDHEVGRQSVPGAHGELIGTRSLAEVAGLIDVGIMFDVLEHIPDATAALREMRDHVRDDGWPAVTMPWLRRISAPLSPSVRATALPRSRLTIRSVVSEKIGTPEENIVPSFDIGCSSLPSEEKATACSGWVWITQCTSGRARSTSEWI